MNQAKSNKISLVLFFRNSILEVLLGIYDFFINSYYFYRN